jgi:hypothetical protein
VKLINRTKAKAEHHRIITGRRIERESRERWAAGRVRSATTTVRFDGGLPLAADAPPGARVVHASAYAVALCLDGVYLGLFAVGDWGITC